MFSDPLYALPALLLLGVAAQVLAARLRIPAIVPLLAAGLALGPGLGWLRPQELLGGALQPLVALAVALVLFEGGLSLRVKEAVRLGRPLLLLLIGGLVLTFGASTLLARLTIGLSWPTAAVLGAILIVTGPTVIKPMLRQSRLKQRPALLLKWESIVNDPLGALFAVLALEVAVTATVGPGHGRSLGGAAMGIGLAGLGGALLGWGLGLALARHRIPEHLEVPTILTLVLVAFVGGEALYHEAGLLSVTVMGIVLANAAGDEMAAVHRFKEDLATLLVSLLFLVLAAGLTVQDLQALTGGTLVFVALLLFVVRPLAVWLPFAAADMPWREKALLGWIAPRGVVAAAMGGALEPRLLEAGFADANLLVPVLFAVVIATVVAHGLTIGPLARRLDLRADSGKGVLILGVESWTLELADALERAGADVVLLDSDFRRVSRARMGGHDAVHGDVLAQAVLDDVLPVERLSWAIAATQDDAYNALACVNLERLLGRGHALRLTPQPRDGARQTPEVEGERPPVAMPWGPQGTFQAFAGRYWMGHGFATSRIGEEYDWTDFRAERPKALPLFAVGARKLRPLRPDNEDAEEGERIVFQAG